MSLYHEVLAFADLYNLGVSEMARHCETARTTMKKIYNEEMVSADTHAKVRAALRKKPNMDLVRINKPEVNGRKGGETTRRKVQSGELPSDHYIRMGQMGGRRPKRRGK